MYVIIQLFKLISQCSFNCCIFNYMINDDIYLYFICPLITMLSFRTCQNCVALQICRLLHSIMNESNYVEGIVVLYTLSYSNIRRAKECYPTTTKYRQELYPTIKYFNRRISTQEPRSHFRQCVKCYIGSQNYECYFSLLFTFSKCFDLVFQLF